MKKVLASITVFFYFIVSCGVVINLHYCMGSYQSFSLYESQNRKCGKCGMHIEENNGCCRDEVKIIKLQDDQNVTNVSHGIQGIEVEAMTPSDFIIASIANVEDLLHYNNHSPPLLTEQDTYLQNCVFRI